MEQIILIHGSGHRAASWTETVSCLDHREDVLCPELSALLGGKEAGYPNRYAAVLYECSSLMPEVFDEAIREAKGPGATPPFRGMSYNASAEQLITMLNIGSISVKTE